MNIVLFSHSLLSCRNHGNTHFLRGVTTELIAQGHGVRVYEPENSWSFANLLREQTWNDPALVKAVGKYKTARNARFRLLSHDTHHRVVSAEKDMAALCAARKPPSRF